MPELPEVETIAKELKKKIVGLKITDVWADKEKPFRQSGGLKKFLKEVKNKKIIDVRRRAKFVVIDMEGPKSIFVHQKISGHLLYGKWRKKSEILNPKSEINSKFKIQNSKQEEWTAVEKGPLRDDPHNRFIRIIFFLNNAHQMALSDLRRFGKVMLVGDKEIENLKEFKKLGPEPLEISFDQFKNLFTPPSSRLPTPPKQLRLRRPGRRASKKKGRLKPVLMDPYFIAGIGNIYSDEILWDAGYHPLKRVENLKKGDLKKIYNSIGKVLKKAIKYRGDSMDDYRLPNGEKGHYQEIQNAYQQTGKKCKKRDGGIIQRIKVGGRSAHFCPVHQKL